MKHNPFRYLAWLSLAAILFVTVSPIDWRPDDVLPADVDRALACGVFAGLFVLAYPRQWPWVGAAMVLGAGLMELLQELSPTRHARFDDAMVKAMGAFIGVTLGALLASALKLDRPARTRPRLVTPDYRPLRSSGTATMQAVPVTSRMIEAVYFSPEDGLLRLRFKNGEERLFAGVPYAEVLAMTQSPSPGRFYAEKIRPNYTKIAA
jgi:hypothetical protein